MLWPPSRASSASHGLERVGSNLPQLHSSGSHIRLAKKTILLRVESRQLIFSLSGESGANTRR